MLAFIQRSFIICLGSSSLLWYTDLVMLSISVRHLLKANPQRNHRHYDSCICLLRRGLGMFLPWLISLCSTYYNSRVWFRKWWEAGSELLLAGLTTKASRRPKGALAFSISLLSPIQEKKLVNTSWKLPLWLCWWDHLQLLLRESINLLERRKMVDYDRVSPIP